MNETRCYMCGMRMHRYGFSMNYGPADIDKHQPSAVACVNNIIGALEAATDEPTPRGVVRALTQMGYTINVLVGKQKR